MTDTPLVIESNQAPAQVRSRRGRRLFVLVLLLLLTLLVVASYLLFRLITPAGAPAPGEDRSGITWVRSIYGLSEAPEDQFLRVQSAVPGPDGSIWVNDGSRRAVFQFTPDGQFVRQVTGPEIAPLSIPGRVAFGPDGLMYVTEAPTDLVRVLDQDGEDAGSFGIPTPFSIAVTEDMIAVGTRYGFAILDKEGNPQQIIGSLGQGDDQFDYVHGIAIGENGNVYVADSFNNRLSAYDAEGNRLWIVRTGLPTNQAEMVDDRLTITADVEPDLVESEALQLPMGLTIDGAGRLVVIDMFECAIAVFDPDDGSFIGKYGDFGNEDGEFLYPTSIGYDAERDWFTVADMANSRAQVVRIPGSSAGNDAETAMRRVLSGPLRACIFPLLLLLLIVVIWLVVRAVRRRRSRPQSLVATPEPIEPIEISED